MNKFIFLAFELERIERVDPNNICEFVSKYHVGTFTRCVEITKN